jgi:hypothetical protein
MACCFLGALIISQILAIWRDRRRMALYGSIALVASGLLGWQIDAHLHHVNQWVAEARTYIDGEDPAALAFVRPTLDCRVGSTQSRSASAE